MAPLAISGDLLAVLRVPFPAWGFPLSGEASTGLVCWSRLRNGLDGMPAPSPPTVGRPRSEAVRNLVRAAEAVMAAHWVSHHEVESSATRRPGYITRRDVCGWCV
jgi:hypothetical protein